MSDQSTILIIEDDEDQLRLIEVHLKRAGYAVLRALTAMEGIQAARESGPNLIVLDIRMQPHTGFDVLGELRADDLTRSIPVICTSVMELSARSHEAGADAFILKPFSQSELNDTIGQLLGA